MVCYVMSCHHALQQTAAAAVETRNPICAAAMQGKQPSHSLYTTPATVLKETVDCFNDCKYAKCPITSGRLPFLDVNYDLPYGRTRFQLLPTTPPPATATRTLAFD